MWACDRGPSSLWRRGAESNLSRFAGVSAARARRRNPERSEGPLTPMSFGKRLEARGGIEPPIEVLQTSALPLGDRAPRRVRRKTPASCEGGEFWSGRRDLNPRLRPWQGRTLPLSYSRLFSHSTVLAYLLTIHCTRTGTRSSGLRSSPLPSVLPFGRKRSMN